MQNFVYADTDNNIGYYAPGALPIRPKGDGTLPMPGWTGEHDWDAAMCPLSSCRIVYNPPRGWVVSANNRVAPDGYPHLIGSGFAAPYRAARIVELIQSKAKLSPDDMAAIQADVRSAQARELLPYLLQVQPSDERGRAAIELLRGWDGSASGDSAAAAVYQAWYQRIPAQIFADELGQQLWEEYADEKILSRWRSPACSKARAATGATTPARRRPSCVATFGAALAGGLDEMARHQGSDDPGSWRWDRVHHTIFPHNPFDEVGALKPIFSRSTPNGGDGFTINVAPIRNSELYNQYHIASYRQIIDLADLGASRYIHTTGQSGQLLDRHYGDLIARWQRLDYLPMRYDTEAINAAAAARLVLDPERPLEKVYAKREPLKPGALWANC